MSKNNQKFNSASQNISESHAPFSVGLSCLSNALSVSTYITASQSAAPNDINIPKTTVPSNAFVCTSNPVAYQKSHSKCLRLFVTLTISITVMTTTATHWMHEMSFFNMKYLMRATQIVTEEKKTM